MKTNYSLSLKCKFTAILFTVCLLCNFSLYAHVEIKNTDDCLVFEKNESDFEIRGVNSLLDIPELDQPANRVFCAGDIVPVISFSGTNIAHITWTVAGEYEIGLPAESGTGDVSSFTAINDSDNPLLVTITVTPESADGDKGEEKTFTITVNPLPKLNPIGNLTYCSGDIVFDIFFTGKNIQTVTWVSPEGKKIGIPVDSAQGNMGAFRAKYNGVDTATFTVTPKSAMGCIGEKRTFTITVNPLPELDPIQDMVFAADEIVPTISFTGEKIVGVKWEVISGSGTEIGLPAESGSGNISSFTATNTTQNFLSATIRVKPDDVHGCKGYSETFNISVRVKIDTIIITDPDTIPIDPDPDPDPDTIPTDPEIIVIEINNGFPLQVYPNPTTGRLTIEMSDMRYEMLDIAIFDVMGRKLSQNLKSEIVNRKSEIVLDISHLPAGIYFLRVANQMVKIMKE